MWSTMLTQNFALDTLNWADYTINYLEYSNILC
jgi:hypothetical protein